MGWWGELGGVGDWGVGVLGEGEVGVEGGELGGGRWWGWW